MDLICYVKEGWAPRIRPASPKREWMDSTTDSFAYRCLPLNIANAHGWEILSPCGFEARWNGGDGADAVEIRLDEGTVAREAPVSLFGYGTVTFHVDGILRTPEGWNLWVGGPPNRAKDAIAPLGGVVETDWSPYTFTMNWRFTRPGQWVRFERNEPFAFVFPIERERLEEVVPRLMPIEAEPGLAEQFEAWSRSRNEFQERMRTAPPARRSESWQKLYYRGVRPDGSPGASGHRSKLRLAPFSRPDGTSLDFPEEPRCPRRQPGPPVHASGEDALALRKREWLLETLERQRALSVKARTIHRWRGLDRQTFLDDYYAPGRPVIVDGAMAAWAALELWTPDYLAAKLGSVPIEVQAGRSSSARYELDKEAHRRVMPFDAFVREAAGGAGNDLYLTANNSERNGAALVPLEEDVGTFEAFLDPAGPNPRGMPWIGGAGTFTPLHHDLTNNLLAQVRGRKRIVLAPPSETPKLYNRAGVFSDLHDIERAQARPDLFPKAVGVRLLELILQPGEALFIPVGWWHQVTALDFSVSFTFTNFLWPNYAHADFPSG